MKKTLTAAALSSVLVLGLATSALAIHTTDTAEEPVVAAGPSKITIDGDIRLRGAYDKNSATEGTEASAGYDTRVQLGVKAQVSPEATGYVKLESGQNSWNGSGGDSDVYGWGAGMVDNTIAANAGGMNGGLFSGGNKMGGLNILEAWINYQPLDCGKPGAWGVKAGHMPLALGNKLFFDHTGSGDDAIVLYGNLNETTHVAALTIKFDEGLDFDHINVKAFDNVATNDLDGYVALITSKINDNLNLGANYTYLNGRDSIADVVEEYNPGVQGVLSGFALSNIGLTADGKVGAIDYMADVEFQFGTFQDGHHDFGTHDMDVDGWAMKVAANYDLGGGKIGALFGYGSGNDQHSHDQEAFVNFLTDTTYDTIIAGYRSAIPGAGDGLNTKNTGLSNLTLLQVNGSTKTVCPLTGKDLSLFASLSYMQLSEDIEDNHGHDVDNVGTELDLIATWELTAGLNYKVEAAYLFTGDVYEHSVYGHNPDDLAFLRNTLELKF